jgi:hypothetical protein
MTPPSTQLALTLPFPVTNENMLENNQRFTSGGVPIHPELL